ncbi:MAG: MTH938/NDUFAF3 family protein [Candidatus Atribacteria bacterium]|nr:MTH938/NDUFAF3 family protein [Candidatus Atribacteria bacterium]
MIEEYIFGQISISGKKYNSDLIIFKDHIYDNWWRKEGHNLYIDDVKEIINKKPDILIIGTGFYGLMKVSPEIRKYLESIGIKLIIKKTKDACEDYNKLYKDKNIIAAFHLTC